jgi:hypothetical protein
MSANRQATIGRRWGQFKPSEWGQIRASFSERIDEDTRSLSCPHQAYILALFTGHIASQTRVRELACLQAIPAVFECSEHLSENRGVPGSSPGLAIPKPEIPHGCKMLWSAGRWLDALGFSCRELVVGG